MPMVTGGIMVGIAAAGLISDYIGGKESAKAAKRAGLRESGQEQDITRERLRKLDIEERTMAGTTRARAAASNVKAGAGSPLLNLAEQAREFGYERDLTKRVGATKAGNAYQRGTDQARMQKYSSYSNIAKGASNIFGIMHSSGMFSKGTTT